MTDHVSTEKESLENLNHIPFVSVIVPVYNDEHRICKCIESLLNQTYPQNRYEVVVVDNGSTDKTCDIVKTYPVSLLVEDKIQSSYAARNRGIHNSKGEVIAFTDSDCIPEKDWIEKGVSHLLGASDCGLVGGNITLFYNDPENPNAVELYDTVRGFNQKRDIEQYKFGSTANVFTYRKVFEHVGLFNDTLRSGGDNEWGKRVFEHGYQVIYANDALIRHPARNSFKQLKNRLTRLTGGNYDQRGNNITYLVSVIQGIRYSATTIIRIILNMPPADQLSGLRQKTKFIIATIFVFFVSNIERVRLLSGGASRR